MRKPELNISWLGDTKIDSREDHKGTNFILLQSCLVILVYCSKKVGITSNVTVVRAPKSVVIKKKASIFVTSND